MRKIFTLMIALCLSASALYAQWVPQATGFSLPSVGVNYISAVDQNVLWAVGYDGSGTAAEIQMVTRTNNGGDLWTAAEIPGYSAYGVAMICAIDYNTAWVPVFTSNAQGGAILKTTDGGATWTAQTTAAFTAPDGFPNVVHFWNANEGFCMGDPNGGYFEIYTTTDGGTTWVRVPQANVPAMLSGEFGVVGYYSVVGDNVWFGTNKGRVFKSSDKGLTWVAYATGFSTSTYVDVRFLDANHGIAIDRGQTSTGAKRETFDGGATWSLITQTGTVYTGGFSWVPGLANTCVSSGAATGLSGIAYSIDGAHNWTDFNGTSGIQFLFTQWVDNSHGWAGDFTDAVTPSTLGGMYKYNGVLTDILNVDPKQGDVKIYPNPSNGQFTFAVIGFEGKDVNVNIYNAVGQKVYSHTSNESLVSYNHVVDLTQFGTGVYVAEVQCGKKLIQQKLIVE